MESRFQQDFSKVRIHADSRAGESAKGVNALAYTVGRHISFAPNEYAPQTSVGKRLLAHELAHVVQQRSAPAELQRFSALPVVDPAPNLEAEAEHAADFATSGKTVGSLSSVNQAKPLQRKDVDQKDTGAKDTGAKDTGAKDAGAANAPGDTSAKSGEKMQSHGCIQELVGQDPESVLRLDTVTVVEFGGDYCQGCKLMSQDLNELCQEFAAKQQKIKFRVVSINIDKDENEEIFKRLKAKTGITTIPQTFVYTEREQSDFYDGYINTIDYQAKIREIFVAAGSKGVFKGMKWGAIAGSLAGGLAGSIAGGIMASKGGSDVFTGIALGGLLGGAIGSAAGLGLGSLLGAAFSKDKGAAVLSEERIKEVKEYVLGKTDKDGKLIETGVHQNKRIRGDSKADDLARDAVDYWIDHQDSFPLDAVDRRVLILEMLDGYLSSDDERGIIKILENSSDADILRIINGVGVTEGDDKQEKVSFEDLQGRFSGTELATLNSILNRLKGNFPIDAPKTETKGRWIDRSFVKSEMKKGVETTQKQSEYSEVAGIFLDSGNPDAPLSYQQLFVGSRSQMNEVADTARDKLGKDKAALASFHTHHTIPEKWKGRLAPSAADLISPVDNKRMFGDEHYVINPWVIHLINIKGQLIQIGNTNELLGTERPPVPKGVTSTLELQ